MEPRIGARRRRDGDIGPEIENAVEAEFGIARLNPDIDAGMQLAERRDQVHRQIWGIGEYGQRSGAQGAGGAEDLAGLVLGLEEAPGHGEQPPLPCRLALRDEREQAPRQRADGNEDGQRNGFDRHGRLLRN